MVIDLSSLVQEVQRTRAGRTDTITVIVEAGKLMKLEISPNGEEIASGTVPTGKVWEVDFTFSIVERDA